jgi:hypothetical protein
LFLWKCEYESNGCWRWIKTSTMECQIGPCAKCVLLEQACNSAKQFGTNMSTGIDCRCGEDCQHWLVVLGKEFFVENFIKKHTIPITNNRSDSINPKWPLQHPVPAPAISSTKKSPKHAGSKVLKVVYLIFCLWEFKLSHVIITALQQRRGEERSRVENDNLCLWVMN